MLRIGGEKRKREIASVVNVGGILKRGDECKESTTNELRKNATREKNNHEENKITGVSQRLKGSRFRKINEYLYTNKSDDAFNEYLKDDNMFEQYHSGYNAQKRLWPLDPLDKVIEYIRVNDKIKVIGDFGCGMAKINQLFGNKKGYKIYSFDLNCSKDFAYENNITICNIKSVPLNDNILDLAVFCLSLMGTDWPLFIAEAYRVVKYQGLIIITEVTSRLNSIPIFISNIEKFNLKLIGSPTNITNYFTQFIFTKVNANGDHCTFKTKNIVDSKYVNNRRRTTGTEQLKKTGLNKDNNNRVVKYIRRSSTPLFPAKLNAKRFFSYKLRLINVLKSLKSTNHKSSLRSNQTYNHSETILIASNIDHTLLKPCVYKKR
ncbi:Rrp8p like methyltransferase involved in rRNA processing [Cryptosporidium xiaoi]|uniref:Ribosomal RNA-processing protein 8 n=1 Tax=Cryptosporidium xiaoi TaxID=659607 RepID=A0AAV9Y3N4_9CRYT